MLLHLLRLIETYSFDSIVYATLGSESGPLEVQWRRDQGQTPWSWRRRGTDDLWAQESALGVLASLSDQGADLEALRAELSAAALTQVVHASLLQRDAARVLGDRAVNDALRGYQAFTQQVEDALRRLTLEELDGGAPAAGSPRAHLRLVGPETEGP